MNRYCLQMPRSGRFSGCQRGPEVTE